ncbi:hypothetical protein RI367_002244 [Sorochytrium milnesiophthora]
MPTLDSAKLLAFDTLLLTHSLSSMQVCMDVVSFPSRSALQRSHSSETSLSAGSGQSHRLSMPPSPRFDRRSFAAAAYPSPEPSPTEEHSQFLRQADDMTVAANALPAPTLRRPKLVPRLHPASVAVDQALPSSPTLKRRRPLSLSCECLPKARALAADDDNAPAPARHILKRRRCALADIRDFL